MLSRQGSREGEAAAPQQAAAAVKDAQDASVRRSESKMKAMLRDEVLINAQKFKIQVCHHHLIRLASFSVYFMLYLYIKVMITSRYIFSVILATKICNLYAEMVQGRTLFYNA